MLSTDRKLMVLFLFISLLLRFSYGTHKNYHPEKTGLLVWHLGMGWFQRLLSEIEKSHAELMFALTGFTVAPHSQI